MARVPIPIPGKDKDYDSRKSRAQLINLLVDLNDDGSFKAIVKREGVFSSDDSGGDNLISNFTVDGLGDVYIAGITDLYLVGPAGVLTSQGAHGITFPGDLRLISNDATPAQTFIYDVGAPTGTNAVVFKSGTGFTAVTDVTWTANDAKSGAYLNTRFWFVSLTTTPLFYGSDSLDGLSFDPLTFALADEEVGLLQATRAYKSSIWFFKSKSVE